MHGSSMKAHASRQVGVTSMAKKVIETGQTIYEHDLATIINRLLGSKPNDWGIYTGSKYIVIEVIDE